jgi:hypothetical protein
MTNLLERHETISSDGAGKMAGSAALAVAASSGLDMKSINPMQAIASARRHKQGRPEVVGNPLTRVDFQASSE